MRAASWILAAALALVGCDDQTQVEVDNQFLVQGSLLHRMQASGSIAHRGVRRYEAHGELRGSEHDLSYVEEVEDDGKGCFRIRTVEVQSNLIDTFLYRGLLEERQAFLRRYRDLQLRDFDLVLQNYAVRDLGAEVTVAERACELLSIEARDGKRRFELAVDVETAMVLRYDEVDADGRVTRSMTYLELDLDADLSELDCFGNSIAETELDSGHELGPEAWQPRILPDGYRLSSTSRIDGPLGGTWLKSTYTDGIEALFLLQRELDRAKQAAVTPGGDTVMVFSEGLLTVLQGTVAGREVIAVGRASADELLTFLDSGKP